MDGNKSKEGVSVKEIQGFANKFRFEIFFCLVFILACIFTFVFWGPVWSIVAAVVGAIIGVLLEEKMTQFSKMIFSFVFKQEPTVQIVLGVVGLILAIFIPPLYFLLLGIHGGKDMQHWAVEIYNQIRSR